MGETKPATKGLDAKHLGQLLLMQSVLDSLPDMQSIHSFVARGLSEMPGVAEARIRDASGEAPARDTLCFPLQVGEAQQGELLVTCNDLAAFQPYEDYIRNFCFMVAVILEERQQRQLLESRQVELAERTAEVQWRVNQLQRLAAQLTQAEERERHRLAQFLHDHLQQVLVAVKLRLSSVEIRTQGTRAASAVTEAGLLLDEAIRDSRSMTTELSPPVLYDGGLAAGLEWLCHEAERRYHLSVTVQTDLDLEPDELTTRILVFQAARELILNAVKHAQASSLKVCLSKLGDEQLQLMIEDDGVGFDPEVINRKGGDGGFGLFSIRERLEVIGGRLTIASNAVEGTKVAIMVPCTQTLQAKRSEDAKNVSQLPPCIVPAHTDRVRVLLADDHPVLRKGLSDMLMEHPDINVVGGAKDGQEAIEMALQLHPDVVLMDISMPRVDGIEATRQIKRATPDISVIGLSMHETEEMAATMHNAGATEYLTKTTPVEDLVAAILRSSSKNQSKSLQ